jgi:hypothetical protein
MAAPSYRERLERFYRHYAPEKLSVVDDALLAFEGHEEDLFFTITEKYGPEPPLGDDHGRTAVATRLPPQPADNADSGTSRAQLSRLTYRQRLTRFYEHYAPEKLVMVEAALKNYEGREDDMMTFVVGKYGPEPPLVTDSTSAVSVSTGQRQTGGPTATPPVAADVSERAEYGARLRRFYAKYDCTKLEGDAVDKALDGFAGRYDRMIELVVKKYGPEPTDAAQAVPMSVADNAASPVAAGSSKLPTASASDRSVRDLPRGSRSTPDVTAVDTSTDAHVLVTARPESHLASNDSSNAQGTASPAADASPSATSAVLAVRVTNPLTHRERVVRLYKYYAPEKLANVDQAMNHYAGREDVMLNALIDKYGPEPPVNVVIEHQRLANDGDKHGSGTSAGTPPPPAVFTHEPRQRAATSFMATSAAVSHADVDGQPTATRPRAQTSFGSVPHPARQPADVSDTQRLSRLSYRQRLTRFYEHYAPEKLVMVDAALQKYEGREDEMMTFVVDKYGPEPPLVTDSTSAVSVSTGQRQTGGPTATPPAAADVSERAKYGARLRRFYAKYDCTKLEGDAVDKALDGFAGRYDRMIELVVKKYGPEPAAEQAPSSTTPDATIANLPAPIDNPRGRLARFYERYAPEKLSTVDAALARYDGNEEELFLILVERYGPEPPLAATTTTLSPTTGPAPVQATPPTSASAVSQQVMFPSSEQAATQLAVAQVAADSSRSPPTPRPTAKERAAASDPAGSVASAATPIEALPVASASSASRRGSVLLGDAAAVAAAASSYSGTFGIRPTRHRTPPPEPRVDRLPLSRTPSSSSASSDTRSSDSARDPATHIDSASKNAVNPPSIHPNKVGLQSASTARGRVAAAASSQDNGATATPLAGSPSVEEIDNSWLSFTQSMRQQAAAQTDTRPHQPQRQSATTQNFRPVRDTPVLPSSFTSSPAALVSMAARRSVEGRTPPGALDRLQFSPVRSGSLSSAAADGSAPRETTPLKYHVVVPDAQRTSPQKNRRVVHRSSDTGSADDDDDDEEDNWDALGPSRKALPTPVAITREEYRDVASSAHPWRRVVLRRFLRERRHPATVSAGAGHLLRGVICGVVDLPESAMDSFHHACATMLQALFRGHRARRCCERWLCQRLRAAAERTAGAHVARDRHEAAEVEFGFLRCEARLRRQRVSDFAAAEATERKEAIEDRRRLVLHMRSEAAAADEAAARNYTEALRRQNATARAARHFTAVRAEVEQLCRVRGITAGVSPRHSPRWSPGRVSAGPIEPQPRELRTRAPVSDAAAHPSSPSRRSIANAQRTSPLRRHVLRSHRAPAIAANCTQPDVRASWPSGEGDLNGTRPVAADRIGSADRGPTGLTRPVDRTWHERHMAAVKGRWKKEGTARYTAGCGMDWW